MVLQAVEGGSGHRGMSGGGSRRRQRPQPRSCSRLRKVPPAAARQAPAALAAADTGAGAGLAPAEAKRTAAAAAAATADDAATAAIEAAERESLELLEWPALCRQVACFTRTPMGAEVALQGRLPLGRSQQESERLLRETGEAQQAELE